MLPGIRFLFAAVVFAVSLVIFGLGAAALLRSAHEEFASLPTRRVAPPAIFAQQQNEPQPTLSMLRVDTPAPDTVPPQAVTTVPPIEAAPVVAVPAEAEKTMTPETVAALTPPAAPPPETPAAIDTTAQPEAAKIEAPEPVTTVAVAPATPAEASVAPTTQVAVASPVQVPDVETSTASQATATLTEDDAKLSSTKIAVLGGPPVDTEPVPLPVAKPVVIPVKKVAKKPAPKKRRVAARPVAAAAPPQTDPFGLPLTR